MKVLIENIASVAEMDLMEKPQEITQERWARIMRIRPIEDKKRSLLAGRLLHKMCQECGVTDPIYGTTGNGKPILRGTHVPAFGISHSGEYVVVVYAENVSAVGVDIQQIKSMSEGLKKRLLHEKEWEILSDGPFAFQKDVEEIGRDQEIGETLLLNRIWAIKESYVKMTGEGLGHDFRKICVDLKEHIVTDENGGSVPFFEPETPDGYVMAVIIKE